MMPMCISRLKGSHDRAVKWYQRIANCLSLMTQDTRHKTQTHCSCPSGRGELPWFHHSKETDVQGTGLSVADVVTLSVACTAAATDTTAQNKNVADMDNS